MAECTNPDLGRMLHHYELGMLTGEKRSAFEAHLFECDHCFEAAQASRHTASLIKYDEPVRDTVRQLVEEEAAIEAPIAAEPTRIAIRKWRPSLYIPLAAAAAIFLVLILKDWQFEFRPSHEAQAQLDRLAVMYFDNLVDPDDSLRLGDMATHLVITGLSGSQHMDVVSGQHLYDILKSLGREGEKRLDQSLASEVAIKAKARWMVLGSILQVEPQLVVSSQLVEVENGRIIASQQVSGDPDEEIFAVIGRLNQEIRAELPLANDAHQEPVRVLGDRTTESPEALRYYLDGLDSRYKWELEGAKSNFRKAVQADTTFAMAYFWLALMTKGAEQPVMIQQALRYSDKVSEKELYYLRYMEARVQYHIAQAHEELQRLLERYPFEKLAYTFMGDDCYEWLAQYDDARRYYRRAIDIDAFYKHAYRGLAWSDAALDNADSAIWAINKYLDLAPDEPNPHDTRGGIYAWAGQLELAIESYNRALDLNPDFGSSIEALGHIYSYRREYELADSLFRRLTANRSARMRAEARKHLAIVDLHQGQFRKAIHRLGLGMDADSLELGDQYPDKHLRKLWYRVNTNLRYTRDNDAVEADAKRLLAQARRVDPSGAISRSYRGSAAKALAMVGLRRGDTASANAFLDSVYRTMDTLSYWHPDWVYSCYGQIEYEKGNFDTSIAYFERLWVPQAWWVKQWYLGMNYIELGRYADAAVELEKTVGSYRVERGYNGIVSIVCRYYLGRAYEGLGQYDRASEQYRIFLDYWGDADTPIPEVEDARERLARMQT